MGFRGDYRLTYYKVKTARDIIPTYADYIKLQTHDSYVASSITVNNEPKKEQKPPNPIVVSPFNHFLKYLVLKLLDEKPLSCSEIIEEILTQTDKCWKPPSGLIYRLLDWLKENGYTAEVPKIAPPDFNYDFDARINRYVLTEKGKELLKEPVSNNRKFIEEKFLRVKREKTVLDCACGGGAEIQNLKEMGFENVVGLELNGTFIKTAQKVAYGVVKGDMHSPSFRDGSFDAIFSAHTIEHAYYPARLLQEFFRILKPDGQLFVILPYPDGGHEDDFHVAKYELGTNILDGGKSVIKFFEENGFRLDIREDSRGLAQEPLIWLQFRKRSFQRGKPYRPC